MEQDKKPRGKYLWCQKGLSTAEQKAWLQNTMDLKFAFSFLSHLPFPREPAASDESQLWDSFFSPLAMDDVDIIREKCVSDSCWSLLFISHSRYVFSDLFGFVSIH